MFQSSIFDKIVGFFNPMQKYDVVLPVWEQIVAQSRQKSFYLEGKVPDTLDGRYELICLHSFLIMHRLVDEGAQAKEFSQKLFDYMIHDFDSNLREIGISDLKVGDRVKEMGRGFYGRVVAYRDGLKQSDDVSLCEAIDRNIFGTVATPELQTVQQFAKYIREQSAHLALVSSEKVIQGAPEFIIPDFK